MLNHQCGFFVPPARTHRVDRHGLRPRGACGRPHHRAPGAGAGRCGGESARGTRRPRGVWRDVGPGARGSGARRRPRFARHAVAGTDDVEAARELFEAAQAAAACADGTRSSRSRFTTRAAADGVGRTGVRAALRKIAEGEKPGSSSRSALGLRLVYVTPVIDGTIASERSASRAIESSAAASGPPCGPAFGCPASPPPDVRLELLPVRGRRAPANSSRNPDTRRRQPLVTAAVSRTGSRAGRAHGAKSRHSARGDGGRLSVLLLAARCSIGGDRTRARDPVRRGGRCSSPSPSRQASPGSWPRRPTGATPRSFPVPPTRRRCVVVPGLAVRLSHHRRGLAALSRCRLRARRVAASEPACPAPGRLASVDGWLLRRAAGRRNRRVGDRALALHVAGGHDCEHHARSPPFLAAPVERRAHSPSVRHRHLGRERTCRDRPALQGRLSAVADCARTLKRSTGSHRLLDVAVRNDRGSSRGG